MTMNQKRVSTLKDIISNTVLSIQKYKSNDIFGANEANVCIIHLEELNDELNSSKNHDSENKIQINLSNIFKMFGTYNLKDLFYVSFPYIKVIKSIKYNSLCKYFHPVGYKIINDNQRETLRELGIHKKNNYDCIPIDVSNSFQNKVNGLKFVIKYKNQRILIYGIVDNIIPNMVTDEYINSCYNDIIKKKHEDYFQDTTFETYVDSLTIKDYLIYSLDELITKYKSMLNVINSMKRKSISVIIKDFLKSDLYEQRNIIITLLINNTDNNHQYLAYLLYDLLSSENGENIDTQEQIMLYDGFPWGIKKLFKDAMKNTITYTNHLCHIDDKKIPLEQQICLLSTSDAVKEKAMQKLSEVKSKTDDSGTKARQYLDGLLSIPFNIFREEPILQLSNSIQSLYLKTYNEKKNVSEIKHIIKNVDYEFYYSKRIKILKEVLIYSNRSKLVSLIKILNERSKNYSLPRISYSSQTINVMKERVDSFLNTYKKHEIMDDIIKYYNLNIFNVNDLIHNTEEIKQNISQQSKLMYTVRDNLDKAIYGHDKPKKQIERIIAQWINGENSGYCFGFEGPPGVGKTTFAKKGVSNCLTNELGESRPFAYIAIGGSSNASTLDGHSYTYVGSTWGRIVDIVIEKKCLNPIIFIDELDKVSKTESGREIISILTHLTDSSQNSVFQDKYFSGIDVDMSKALFIFSYNDVSAIDQILLDRIHRISFEPLTLNEKIVIVKQFIFPEICTKMGLLDSLTIDDKTIELLISKYTNESGVRKLKELLFEIVGEINLSLLKKDTMVEFPYEITIDDIEKKHLNEHPTVDILHINNEPKVGVINGLWANSVLGGILQIECLYYPTESLLDLKLTGLQGDVMKESMHVARTLSWSLLDKKTKASLNKKFETSKSKGIHVHCPEGAIQKDGPSAGGAIVILMYSLLTNKKIRNDVAMTGEITMQGKITKIGGLQFKIMGGIKGGVKEFILPEENRKDFDLIRDKNLYDLTNIKFNFVKTINEALKIALVK